MATVDRITDSSFRVIVPCGYDVNGKQIRKTRTFKLDSSLTKKQREKEIERQKVLFEQQVRDGVSIDCNIKFEEFAKQWIEQAERVGELKPLSLKRLKQCQARTYKAIGHLSMGKINRRHIQAFINNLAEDGINTKTGGGLSTKTQKLYLNFISDVFNYAIACDMNVKNPCEKVKAIRTEKQEKEVYTLEETMHFLELLNDEPLKYKAFFTLAIFGGFRRGELLGFEWQDVDFDNCIISVVRNSLFDKEQGGMFTGTPKTKTSQRSLRLPQVVFDVLKEHKAWQSADRLKLGSEWVNTNRVFTAWNGEPMGADTARHWLEKFCKRKNIKYVSLHSFRHLNATLLINNGVDARTVSSMLGHSQVSTTLNIYAHTFAESQARASEAVAEVLLKQA